MQIVEMCGWELIASLQWPEIIKLLFTTSMSPDSTLLQSDNPQIIRGHSVVFNIPETHNPSSAGDHKLDTPIIQATRLNKIVYVCSLVGHSQTT